MEIFLSWSGEASNAVAKTLRNWIPHVFQSTRPWLSSADIDPGNRWSVELSNKLSKVDFGILCLTKENMDSPWLLFEAGAISREIQNTRVVPYLVDFEPSQLHGPLSQFQAVTATLEGTKALVSAIAAADPANIRDAETLQNVYEMWWPNLDKAISEIKSDHAMNKIRINDVRVFTERELIVLKYISIGLNRNEIAEKLTSSPETIASYMRNIFSKLGVKL